jgi:hypothetical protein
MREIRTFFCQREGEREGERERERERERGQAECTKNNWK